MSHSYMFYDIQRFTSTVMEKISKMAWITVICRFKFNNFSPQGIWFQNLFCPKLEVGCMGGGVINLLRTKNGNGMIFCIDDVPSLNNCKFDDYVVCIHPTEHYTLTYTLKLTVQNETLPQ